MAFKDRQFVDKNCPALQDILKSVVLELNSVFLQDRRDLIFDVCDSRDVVCDLQFLEDEDINNVPSIYAKPMTLKLLRSKLLQHKWGDAALILLGFAKLHWNKSGLNVYKEISWKVGNEIILHHPAGYNNTEIIVGHKRATGLSFESLDQTHCLIEHVFVLLSNHDFSSAQDQLRYYRMIDKSITNRNRRAKDIQKWLTLNEGYLGLIEYVIWKSITSQEEEVTQLSGSLQQNEENSPQSVAQRAAAHFATVLSVLGIWDIFVLKLVNIFVYYKKHMEAKQALLIYSQKHDTNPNAHKYLYSFLKGISDLSETNLKIETLQKLQKLNSASELMLDLHQLLFNQWVERTEKILKHEIIELPDVLPSLDVLLQMLDYPCWKSNLTVWLTLHDSLRITMKLVKSEKFRIIENLWVNSHRNSWWPSFHFNPKSANTENEELNNVKYYVAQTFLSKNCKFCKAVKK